MKSPLTAAHSLSAIALVHRACRLALVMVASGPLIAGAAEPVARGASGSYIRFRVDQLPEGKAKLTIKAAMRIHSSPWTLSNINLTPEAVTNTRWTAWVDLKKQPGRAKGSLILNIPKGARGITRFSRYADEGDFVRDIDWNEPDGHKIIVTPDFADVRTFREQERRYYLRTLQQTAGRMFPLSRPPLFFGNAWGHTTGGAAEYMVKSFRLMGLNCVETIADAEKYEALYGWHSQGGHYGPPRFLPYDEVASRAQYQSFYSNYFATGKGAKSAPGMRIFQLADEPGELTLGPTNPLPAFRLWLTNKDIKPGLFGKSSWDEVGLVLKDPKTPEERRLFYWSHKYQDFVTPKMFAMAAEGVRSNAPNREVQSFVALSGHALYFPSKMPLDMFQLAQYPGLMPGISDWMTSGSWNWDSHQAVAFSVAPFNAGARRYGADFGKPPISFPMMHCVNPSYFRAYTQLGNQCKYISYYNYGPDYEVTEGFWSHSWNGMAVQMVGNQAAQMDDILGPGVMRHSRVAMLYATSQDVWWPQASFTDKRATFLALSHNYYQPELVTEEQVADDALAHYDALYVLDPVIPRAAQERIEEWVKGGGLLWACADAAMCDEYNDSYDLLERMAGLKRDNTVVLTNAVQIMAVEGEKAFPPHEVPTSGRKKETIRPGVFMWPDAKVRAVYSDGKPALAEMNVGKGKLVYVGHRCGLSYARLAGARGEFKWWPESGQRELLYVPLKEAKIGQELTVSEPLVMASPISTEAGTVVLLYNMNAQEQTNLTVGLKEPGKPHSVQWCRGGQQLADLPYDYADGRVFVRNLNLPRTGAMILVRRTPPPVDNRIEVMRATAEKGIESTDWQAASAGAWFAGFYPEWNLASRIVPLLTNTHWAVRRSAAESLGRLGYTPAVKPLRAALDQETDTHALADELYALTQLDPKHTKKLFPKYREHPDIFVRQEVERAAALLDDSKKKK